MALNPRGGRHERGLASLHELAFIAATRGLAGAGIGLLLADQLNPVARKAVGWTLLGIGAASTVPLAVSVFRHSSEALPGPR